MEPPASRFILIALICLSGCATPWETNPDIGSQGRDKIDESIRDHKQFFLSCYERFVNDFTTVKQDGKVVIGFRIEHDGSVGITWLENSDLKNNFLETCIRTEIKKIKFAPPPGMIPTIVKYPFGFANHH